jgi:hypothetical protein
VGGFEGQPVPVFYTLTVNFKAPEPKQAAGTAHPPSQPSGRYERPRIKPWSSA